MTRQPIPIHDEKPIPTAKEGDGMWAIANRLFRKLFERSQELRDTTKAQASLIAAQSARIDGIEARHSREMSALTARFDAAILAMERPPR